MVHQSVGSFQRGGFDPLHAVFGSAGGDGGVTDDAGSLSGALLGGGMEAENDGAAGFGRDHGFEHGGGSGVGYGSNASHDTNRLCYLHEAGQLIVFNDAHGFLILDVVPDIFGSKQVFNDFVFVNAAAGFLDRQLRQLGVVIQAGQSHGMGNLVHLFLIELHILGQRGFGFLSQVVDHCLYVHNGCGGSCFFLNHFKTSCYSFQTFLRGMIVNLLTILLYWFSPFLSTE